MTEKQRAEIRSLVIGSFLLLGAAVVFYLLWGDDDSSTLRGTPRSMSGPLMLGAGVFTLLLTGIKAWWYRRHR